MMHRSFREYVRAELSAVYSQAAAIIDRSPITSLNQPATPRSGQLVIKYPYDYAWGKLSTADALTLGDVSRRYADWEALVRPAFTRETNQIAREFEDKARAVHVWVMRDEANGQIPRTTAQAKAKFLERVKELALTVARVFPEDSDGTLVVPDTNWFIHHPELNGWWPIIGKQPVEVRIPPIVLSELDEKKSAGSGNLRQSARRAIRELRALRAKGHLSVGVELPDGHKLRAESREPSSEDVPAWLDFGVPDDRILASALHLQLTAPRHDVYLLTDDLNLQNKAEAVGLPFIETPEESTEDD